jgi:hypothetical protein
MKLPFIDDFSYNSYIPSSTLWEDRSVFINNSYPKGPYSAGLPLLMQLMETASIIQKHRHPFSGRFTHLKTH